MLSLYTSKWYMFGHDELLELFRLSRRNIESLAVEAMKKGLLKVNSDYTHVWYAISLYGGNGA